MEAVQVVLRSKDGCSLCQKAEAALARIGRDVALEVEIRKVPADDPDAERVPIVEIGGQEVQAGKVSEYRLRNWLKERGFLDAAR